MVKNLLFLSALALNLFAGDAVAMQKPAVVKTMAGRQQQQQQKQKQKPAAPKQEETAESQHEAKQNTNNDTQETKKSEEEAKPEQEEEVHVCEYTCISSPCPICYDPLCTIIPPYEEWFCAKCGKNPTREEVDAYYKNLWWS